MTDALAPCIEPIMTLRVEISQEAALLLERQAAVAGVGQATLAARIIEHSVRAQPLETMMQQSVSAELSEGNPTTEAFLEAADAVYLRGLRR